MPTRRLDEAVLFLRAHFSLLERQIFVTILKLKIMSNFQEIIKNIESKSQKKTVPDVRTGETVKVHYKIRESGKERIQIFEGLVIGTKATKSFHGSFTVRKVVDSIGVERTFPLHSPWVTKVERLKSGKVRRAKLNFVRQYALSRRFKLKDKGLAGMIWEQEMPSQQSASGEQPTAETEPLAESRPVPSEIEGELEAESPVDVAETPQTEENTSDELSRESAGRNSGKLGGDSARAQKTADSEAKLPN